MAPAPTSRVGRNKTLPPRRCCDAMPSGSKSSPARWKRFAPCFALNRITPSGCGKIRPSPACCRRRKSGKSNPVSAMHRQQLEHIIRAAAGITGATEFVIVGSQSVLGQFPQAPDELLISIEADVFSLRDPADNDLIDGSIGEGSPFHQTFGYYAHGVSQETAVLPAGWRERLVPVHIRPSLSLFDHPQGHVLPDCCWWRVFHKLRKLKKFTRGHS